LNEKDKLHCRVGVALNVGINFTNEKWEGGKKKQRGGFY
jgi:hypothetical protein